MTGVVTVTMQAYGKQLIAKYSPPAGGENKPRAEEQRCHEVLSSPVNRGLELVYMSPCPWRRQVKRRRAVHGVEPIHLILAAL